MKSIVLVLFSLAVLQLSSCREVNEHGVRPRGSPPPVPSPYDPDLNDWNERVWFGKDPTTTPETPTTTECPICPEDDPNSEAGMITRARRKAVNLMIATAKLTLKTQLAGFNNMSGGYIFKVIDKVLPTDPSFIDKLETTGDLVDPAVMGSLLLEHVAGKVPMGSSVLNAYKDPEAAYNKTKQSLISWIPGAQTAINTYDSVASMVGYKELNEDDEDEYDIMSPLFNE